MECPFCRITEMECHNYTEQYDICRCFNCQIVKYWNKEKNKWVTHKEMNELRMEQK